MSMRLLLPLLLWAGMLQAHPLAPALLQLSETAPGDYQVTWRRFVLQASGEDLAPQLPPACTRSSAIDEQLQDNGSLTARWTLRCDIASLPGSEIRIAGLNASRATVILRLEPLDGEPLQALLDATRPALAWPQADYGGHALLSYFPLGVEHLVLGYDHLLFLLALVLLQRGWRPLVLAVTAFTLGHSLSLALATLGLVSVHTALVECLIAASILWLAAELAAGRQQASLVGRHPGLMPAALGLLHGLGFASVLQDIGLPVGDVPMALLGFNLGIEVAQLLFVAFCLGALALLRHRAWPRPAAAPLLASYAIGSVAAWWCWARGAALLA